MYRIKQILSLLIAVSLMITSNVYSLPQSKTTLRPPLATSKTAKDARKAFSGASDSEVRGAGSISGTISAKDHLALNKEIGNSLRIGYDVLNNVNVREKIVSDVFPPPINLFSVEGLLDRHGIAGHYGIRRFNIFLDSSLLERLSSVEKERYFAHEFYELVRIIHYAMEEFGNRKMKGLALQMKRNEEEISIENALKWFREFSEFNKANSKQVADTLDKLVAFLDEEKNRSEVEPLLSSIHRQAHGLPRLVKAELMKHRLSKQSSEYGDYAALKSLLLEQLKNGDILADAERKFLVGDTEVARLFRKLAGEAIQENTIPYEQQHINIFYEVTLSAVINKLDTLLYYDMEHPVRGAAGAEMASSGAGLAEEANVATFVVLTPEAKNAKIDKLRKEALYAEKAGLWVFAYRRLTELERLNPSEPGISQRKQAAYQDAINQVGPLGEIALERGLIVLYDGIDQNVVTQFKDMHKTDAMSKATSNGSLIERAIKLRHYDQTIKDLAGAEASIEDIFNDIVAKTLIRSGVEAMDEAHQSGEPAGVSIEIESNLDDPAVMSDRANELAMIVGKADMREVTINKIPATGRLGEDRIFKGPGIDTIETAIYNGLYPNITLVMCSRGQIKAVAGAIARGLKRRVGRLQEEGVSNDDIIKELQGFKSYISYFISRVSGELVKNKGIAKKISEAQTKEEKLALAYRFMDLACAFFVDANEIFVEELRNNGFGEFEKLGCPITTELDASTGEKELPADSPVITALTEGKGTITMEELSRHMLIKGFKQNYTNWGYYVFRLARPGTADTIPIDLYNLLKTGKGNDKISAMTLKEAREALMYAEKEFDLNEQTWEKMAAGLITGGVKLFIKAEQTVRLEIAKILIDVAIGNEKYDYAVREIDKLHGQLVGLKEQGAIDDSLQKEVEVLRARINESKAAKLASAEQQSDGTTVLTAPTLKVAAAEEDAGTGTATVGTSEKGSSSASGKSALSTRLDNWAAIRVEERARKGQQGQTAPKEQVAATASQPESAAGTGKIMPKEAITRLNTSNVESQIPLGQRGVSTAIGASL